MIGSRLISSSIGGLRGGRFITCAQAPGLFGSAITPRLAICLAALIIVGGCAAPATEVEVPEDAKVQDLYIVDCLLPGQLRQLGATTYMTPRRPVSTTAIDCRVRGGEYVAYDRADYKTALKVWLPAAEEGDPEAQNTVGEIFEQGLGTDPNFEVAALWYRRAAEQGHKGAQFNLGTLYETGRGVPQSKVEALNWYRKAWGVSEDALTYRSEAEQALVAKAEENARLRENLAAAEARAEESEEKGQAIARDLETLKTTAARAAAELEAQKQVESGAEPASSSANVVGPEQAEVFRSGRDYGRYFALLIGNSDYRFLDDVQTATSDVQRLGEVLQERYGFRVRMLTNGDDASVLRAVNQLNKDLKEEDNLLIYYAGHGSRRESGVYDTGYWLPVNAEPPPDDTFWVPTSQISSHLGRLKARRIMVIADSSFAGLLADNPAFLLASDPASLNSQAYIDLRFPNRSRLLMTSGVDTPAPRQDAEETSVFADALIDALLNNESVLTAPALFYRVLDALETRRPELEPEFKAIKRAGDEVGDFFFVARKD